MQHIAIIIPTYNSAKTIEKTIDSIQAQGNSMSKISAVYLADDCSQDKTVVLAEAKWQSSVPLITLLGKQNLGERANLNRTIDVIKLTCDWILILHSDDIAKPNWLEMMTSRIESCSEKIASICSSWDNLMIDGSIEVGEDNPSREIEVIEGNYEAVRNTLVKGCWWHISGCAIRLKAFEDCGLFNPNLAQSGDWEWLLRCLDSGWSIEYIPKTLILYRQSNASVSSKSFQIHRDIRDFIEILPNYINHLESHVISHLYMQRIKWIIKRLSKSLITLNLQRFLLCFQILFLLMHSFRKIKIS